MADRQRSEAADLHRQASVVDLHAHPSFQVSLFRRSLASWAGPAGAAVWPFRPRTSFPKLRQGDVDLLLSALYAPEAPLFEDVPLLKLLRFLKPGVWRGMVSPAYDRATLNALKAMEAQVAESPTPPGERPVQLVRSVAELDAIIDRGEDAPIAIVHTLEGAHGLQGEVAAKQVQQPVTSEAREEILSNLDAFYARGVALITLAHFYPNYVAAPCFPFPETMLGLSRWREALQRYDPTQGLGPVGEAVVARMAELGMLIDVTHATPPARAQIYQILEASNYRGRVVATHVGVQAINPTPYNLDDWEIRWIADHGGVVGVIFMNYWLMPHETKLGLNYVVRTLQHLVEVGGVDVAALGTDFDGFTDPPDDLLDEAQLPRLTRRLLAAQSSPRQRRFSDEAIGKILGGNALRVLREGWGRKS